MPDGDQADLSPDMLRSLLSNLDSLPVDMLSGLQEQLKVLAEFNAGKASQQDFLTFVRAVWPAFVYGRHHKIMADAFERIRDGSLKRLIINMPPRHTKSELGSIMLPAWYMGHFPDRKIIQTSHTQELATGFGRRVRDLVQSEDYQKIFPGVMLKSDTKAAGRWGTNKRGEYFAIGVGGAVAGKGADLLIIDDPHSEQEAKLGDPAVYDKTYEWYAGGPRQRLQPGGAIVLIMTRWHQRDLTGRIIKRMQERQDVDQWEVIEFPAILPSGNSLWPEYWPLHAMEALRAELPVSNWNAQYQQNPTSEEGALVKREWWRIWNRSRPPECEFIIQSWDCAQTANIDNNPSACTTWGVFKTDETPDGKTRYNIFLLDAFAERMEFPTLKRRAKREYDMWKPDCVIIEGRSDGRPLIYELRAIGIPVQEYTPARGNNKTVRVNAVSDLFQSGFVWMPDTRFADDVREQFAAFPAAEYDDLVDSSTQALLRFRQGGFVRLDTDEEDEPMPRRKAEYY